MFKMFDEIIFNNATGYPEDWDGTSGLKGIWYYLYSNRMPGQNVFCIFIPSNMNKGITPLLWLVNPEIDPITKVNSTIKGHVNFNWKKVK